MRVNSRCAPKAPWIALHELNRGTRARERTASNHHVRDAGGVSAPDYVRSIAVETVVGEVDADVDELGGQWANLRRRQPVLSFQA